MVTDADFKALVYRRHWGSLPVEESWMKRPRKLVSLARQLEGTNNDLDRATLRRIEESIFQQMEKRLMYALPISPDLWFL
jgi:hypothetical protein